MLYLQIFHQYLKMTFDTHDTAPYVQRLNSDEDLLDTPLEIRVPLILSIISFSPSLTTPHKKVKRGLKGCCQDVGANSGWH